MSVDDLARAMAETAPTPSAPAIAQVRDAATLIVVDDSGPSPKVLVGLRGSAHVFMAGKLVFPGGRIDRADLRLAPAFVLSPAVEERLLARTRSAFTSLRATGLALAGIRETFEETGIMIGQAGDFSARAEFWRDFAERGIRPDLAALVPIARAITPPGRVRRYDTRFLAVRAEAIGFRMPFDQRPTDEFERVEWVTIDEMMTADLAPITRRVLQDLRERLNERTIGDASRPMPFYRKLGGRFVRDLV